MNSKKCAKDGGAPDWYRLDLHHCKSCNRTNTLTVKSEKITFDSKGNSKVNSSDFITKLRLAPIPAPQQAPAAQV